MIDRDHPLPDLPPEIPWVLRQVCYAARKLPRGYGRILPMLARSRPCLQTVVMEAADCGPVCLDFRELVCLPVFVHGCFRHQLPEDRVLDTLLRPGMTAFDIGANIGYYTAFLSRRVQEAGRVVAVEPTPRALRLLRKTVRLCGPNIVIKEAAIGSQPGRAEINEMPKLDISFVRFNASQARGAEAETVPVITIDALTQEFGQPDLLKIDIEGAELLALQGASATLSSSSPPVVMIEYIPSHATRFGGYELSDLLQFFPCDRFQAYRILPPGRLLEIGRSAGNSAATNDYLLVPREKAAAIESLKDE